MHSPAPSALARLTPWICFTGTLALYTLTASRTMQGGDTTEFALIGTLGGVAHPPGYPVYSVLARLGAALPIGSPFFRVSMMSALCGAAAVAVLQQAIERITGSLAASLVALAFAVWRQPWRLAGVPEVFSLHALLVATLLLTSIRLVDRPSPRGAAALGLAFGLGLSNHLTIVLCMPLILWPLAHIARGRPVGLALFAGGVLAGLLPYLYLMRAATTAGSDAPVWGETGTWSGLIRHVLRMEYGTLQLAVGQQPAPVRHIWQYIRSVPSDLGYVWLAAALLGIPVALRRRRGLALVLLATVLLSGVLFASRFNLPDDESGREMESRFYLLPHLLLTPFAAFVVAWLFERLRRPIAAFILAGAIVAPLVLHWQSCDWSADSRVERSLIAMAESMPPGGVLVGHGDLLISGMRWVTRVLGIRPDVRYIDATLLLAPWYSARLRRTCPECRLQRATRPRTPFEIASELAFRVPVSMPHARAAPPKSGAVRVDPDGLLDRVVPSTAPPPRLEDVEATLDRETNLIGAEPPPVDTWSGETYLALVLAWDDLGGRYQDAGRPDEAAACRARAARVLAGD